MANLTSFRTKSFIEQISILDEIETGQQVELLPELIELYRTPLGDDGVDQTISDTLRNLLPTAPDTVQQGLADVDPRVRRLCVQVAGKHGMVSLAGDLARLSRTEDDPELLLAVLSALAKLGPAEHKAVFHEHIGNPDPLVTALCVETLGACRDHQALGVFQEIVSRGEDDDRFQACDLTTSKAIEALEALGSTEATRFLVSKIHHRNPNARRLVLEGLTRIGAPVIPHLEPIFAGNQVDDLIMAANLIGFVGDKSGGDLLVATLDRGKAQHPNVRYAVYEALGHIPSLKGLICLLDGMGETDEMLLLAVVTALEPQVNPGIVGKVRDHLRGDPTQAERIVRAIIAARATRLFQLLYADETIAEQLMAAVTVNKDAEIRQAFRETLMALGSERAQADAARLAQGAVSAGKHRVLAADDSKSMLMFYKAVGSQLDLDLETALNGREALDHIERGESFHLVVTDLNMPVMDGVQLTRQIRSGFFCPAVPILMVTTESEGSQVELAQNAGVTAFIQKPLTPAAFAAKLQELLPK